MTRDRRRRLLFLLLCQFYCYNNAKAKTVVEISTTFNRSSTTRRADLNEVPSANLASSSNSADGGGKKTKDEEAYHRAPFLHPIPPPPSSLFQTIPTKLRQDFSTLPVVVNADRISRILRKLANEDMGVYPMQTILDGMLYRKEPFDHADEVKKMTEAIDLRLEDARKSVDEIRRAVLSLFDESPIDMQIFQQFRECCTVDKQLLLYSNRYGSRVNSSFTCDVLPHQRLSAFSFYPGKRLAPIFAVNADRDHSVRWQYFMNADGIHTEFPAHHFDDNQNFSRCLFRARHRRWHAFITAALPYSKAVIIIVDHGSGVSHSQLETGKCIAKSLINTLDDRDRVVALAIGDSVLQSSNCDKSQSSALQFASPAVKARLSQFVGTLVRDADHAANHTLAFLTSFDLFAHLFAGSSKDGLMRDVYPSIIYISRGLLSEITEARQVLATIMNGINRVNHQAGGKADAARRFGGIGSAIQINTVALMEPGKLVMWETQFLQDVASKNFSKHKLLTSSVQSGDRQNGRPHHRLRSTPGKMLLVNTTSNVEAGCLALSDVLILLAHGDYDFRTASASASDDGSITPETHIVLTSEPFEPAFVSLVSAVRSSDGRLLGIAGLDLALSDILSPAVYYTSSDTSAYSIVIDANGFVLYHPKLRVEDEIARVSLSTSATLMFMEEWPTENRRQQLELELAIRNQWYGFYDLRMDDSVNSTRPDRNYIWHKTSNRFLTFVISTAEEPNVVNRKTSRYEPKVYVQHALSYHRLDFRLNKDVRLCYHGKTLASYERAGVFLSPRAFERPYERRTVPETKQSAQGYWAYATDDTRLITNPGLKHGIRHEVGAFSKIVNEWKKQNDKSAYRLSVVRRYLATPSGILLTYPAAVVNQNYDPGLTDWYRGAVQNPGRVVLSRSIFDPYGFGNLATISHTVYEGKSAMHRPGDAVVAVMAIDVPLTFLYKLLFDSLSVCREPGMDCFLFNEHGYVVANRHAFAVDDQMQSVPEGDRAPQRLTEVSHIAHREPSVASEILQRKDFAVKTTCTRVGDETVQRFYLFNTSFADVLRSTDGCLRYQITVVPQTNVFLAVVNRSCHRHSSFCPCSVNDRRCLNCHRGVAEPAESWCECPCECPQNALNADAWCPRRPSNSVHHVADAQQICAHLSPPEAPAQLDGLFLSTVGSKLSSCVPVQCGEFSTENVCRGIMGCEWCTYGSDGHTSLKAPYCAALNSCFGGVQGLMAYSEGETTYDPTAVTTPVGPVAGGVMAIFVLLVAGVYWYRHHVVRLVERRHGRYGSSGSASCLQRFDDSAEAYHFDDGSGGGGGMADGGGGGDDKGPLGGALLLASFERQNLGAGQAPRPRYRPGPRTESSDPGYSTMTGNCDDSEQATTIEPIGVGGRRTGGRISLRLPAILGHKPTMIPTIGLYKTAAVATKTVPASAPTAAAATITDSQPSIIPGMTILPAAVHCGNGHGQKEVPPLGQNSLAEHDGRSTNIVTMALIHQQPALAEA